MISRARLKPHELTWQFWKVRAYFERGFVVSNGLTHHVAWFSTELLDFDLLSCWTLTFRQSFSVKSRNFRNTLVLLINSYVI